MSDQVRRFPLRRPRRLRPRVRPRYRGPSFNRIIPNLMTMVGLCAGLTAMRFALEGRFESAAVAITAAGVIDGLDGRLARLLKGTSRFGAEFEKLVMTTLMSPWPREGALDPDVAAEVVGAA